MDLLPYILIGAASAGISMLTLFSGFGLGTLLMPFFALFFPLDVAVAQTAVVHFLNNLFKLALLGRHANRGIVIRFAVTAIPAALLGAWILLQLTDSLPLVSYAIGLRTAEVTTFKLIMAGLMLFFAAWDFVPRLSRITWEPKHLPWGGLLSGFFGGLSGHQGAFRTAFLVKCGLSKESFIATGVVIACLVDMTRLTTYASHFTRLGLGEHVPLILTTTLCAFLGAWTGSRMLKKSTMAGVQQLVFVMLVVIAGLLASGLI